MKKTSIVTLLSILLFMLVSCSGTASTTEMQENKPDTQAGHGDVMQGEVPISEEEGIKLDPKESSLSFLAVGDNIIYNGQLREGLANGKKTEGAEYDFSSMYENVRDIVSSYDLAFINQETPLAGKSFGYSQYPSFNSPQELGDDLIEVGFDIFNIATNHMLDVGSDGLDGTIEYFKSKDVMMVGGYEDEEDFYDIRIVEKNGIKIAVVGFTYGVNGKRVDASTFIPFIYTKDLTHFATSEKLSDSDRMVKWIEKAKQTADVVIVSMHWGNEYNQTPSSEQRRLAKLLADAGADVILGHHTHCIQPIEWIDGVGENKTLCFYSLGNFTSETDETVSLVGGLASFDIILNERDGVSIENVGFLPTVMDYRNSFNKNTVYLLEDYTDTLCRSHNIVTYFKQKLNMSILFGYVSAAIDRSYLPQSYLDCLS